MDSIGISLAYYNISNSIVNDEQWQHLCSITALTGAMAEIVPFRLGYFQYNPHARICEVNSRADFMAYSRNVKCTMSPSVADFLADWLKYRDLSIYCADVQLWYMGQSPSKDYNVVTFLSDISLHYEHLGLLRSIPELWLAWLTVNPNVTMDMIWSAAELTEALYNPVISAWFRLLPPMTIFGMYISCETYQNAYVLNINRTVIIWFPI